MLQSVQSVQAGSFDHRQSGEAVPSCCNHANVHQRQAAWSMGKSCPPVCSRLASCDMTCKRVVGGCGFAWMLMLE